MDLQSKKYVLALILAAVALFLAQQVYHAARIEKVFSTNASEQDQRILNFTAQSQKFETIDGKAVSQGSAQRPFAVIIENHVESRPQSGISQANLVYEALTEGGITRFLAVYQDEEANSIGPVRSTRTYFNDWAQELKAVLVHVGGNSDALHYLKIGLPGVSDADQFSNGEYIKRISGRFPPHNTYTSLAELRKLQQARKFSSQPTFEKYAFKEDSLQAVPEITSVDVQFSEAAYNVQWRYDQQANSFIRYQDGTKVIDAGNKQPVAVKNLIVQRVKNWPVQSDTPYSVSMGTRQGGSASYFIDGREIKGFWKFLNERTKFLDSTGAEMRFNRGKFWIEIVPPENIVTAKNAQ